MNIELERLEAQIEILEKIYQESKGHVTIPRGLLVNKMHELLHKKFHMEYKNED